MRSSSCAIKAWYRSQQLCQRVSVTLTCAYALLQERKRAEQKGDWGGINKFLNRLLVHPAYFACYSRANDTPECTPSQQC
jgi:hypothetical protein